MTLKPSHIHDLLTLKRDEFTSFDRETWQQLQQYRAALAKLTSDHEADLRSTLATATTHPGAILLEELTTATNGVIPSRLVWQSREQSLAWVRDRLTGITTFAVDGSQIYPGKDLSIPVALVQIGWFENLHLPTGGYEKDIAIDVMTPSDLRESADGGPVDRKVNMRRFQMETQRLIDYMQTHANADDCLVFFDGSLIASFAQTFSDADRQFYVYCLLELLRTSQDYRVPLVAYIDTSQAQDLTLMLQTLFGLPPASTIRDPGLLNSFMEWGDRTPLFLCQRPGILDHYEEQRDQVTFLYLKTTRDGFPARLEMPLWMHKAGLVDRVVDWVRGEVIIGSGYPYVIETADQTAVLQAEDRHAFFRILQDWAEQQELDLRFSRKMVSKVRRR